MNRVRAIEVLKVIKRKEGLPNQGNTWKPNADTIACDMAIAALEEVQQYRELGTLEELREAREKQVKISRKIIEDRYYCPICGKLAEAGHCKYCGQRLY